MFLQKSQWNSADPVYTSQLISIQLEYLFWSCGFYTFTIKYIFIHLSTT